MSYPSIQTVFMEHSAFHPVVRVTYTEGGVPRDYCGDSWCKGNCGLPALVIPAHDKYPEMKAYSNMVAAGHFMQAWRLGWTGAKVEVPQEHWVDFLRKWWA